MSKKALSRANMRFCACILALVMILALVPMTAMAEDHPKPVLIMQENSYADAKTIAVGDVFELGGAQTGPTDHGHTYYQCDMKYKFTINTPSLVKFNISTVKPGTKTCSAHDVPVTVDDLANQLNFQLFSSDVLTADFPEKFYPLEGNTEYVIVNSYEEPLSKDASYNLSPGTYYLRLEVQSGSNAHGWLKFISSVATGDETAAANQTPAASADTPSSWAVEEVNKSIAAGLVPSNLQSLYTQATTRAEFCALAVSLYEKMTNTTITGRATFSDTDDLNVQKMAYIGVVNGVGNNRFDPNGKLNREQAATMLARLANAVSKPFEKKTSTFSDNSSASSWALESIGQVQAAGIMSGTGNNMFSPKNEYTREQSIITMLRVYDALGRTGTPQQPTEPTPTPTPEPTMPPSSGSIDPNLIGMWAYRFLGLNGTDTYIYNFKADGSFEYYVQQNRIIGNYYTSDGKIYLNDMIHTYDNTKWGENKVVEYVFGTDQSGTYLQATQINRDGTYFELKSNSMKYYKEN